MHVTIKNLTNGLRTFRDIQNREIVLRAQDTRSFEAHPHHVRQLKREAEKENPRIELTADPDELAAVDRPGGNMTEEEQAKREFAKRAAAERLSSLRQQAGLPPLIRQWQPPQQRLLPEGEPQTYQAAAEEPAGVAEAEERVESGDQPPVEQVDPPGAIRPDQPAPIKTQPYRKKR